MVGIFSLGHWQQFQQIELTLDLPSWQGYKKVTIHCQRLCCELFIYWELGANLDANGQQMQTCKTVKCFVASLPLLVVELNATLSMDMTFTIDTCSFF